MSGEYTKPKLPTSIYLTASEQSGQKDTEAALAANPFRLSYMIQNLSADSLAILHTKGSGTTPVAVLSEGAAYYDAEYSGAVTVAGDNRDYLVTEYA